jgi:Glycosyltransferase family 87
MRAAPAALVLLTAGWAATLWLSPWSDERVNDLFVYRVFADPVLAGGLPYRDAFLEYPPLAAPAIALPGLLGTGEEVFRAAFAGWTLLLAAAVVLLCGALAARTGGDARRALLAAALTPLLCGALVRTHFDLAPVALLLGALVLLVGGRPRSGMALLGLAAMTKGFPLVAAPVALAWLALQVDRRTLVQSVGSLVAALALPAGAALAMSPEGAWGALTYHLERPVQVESLPASGLMLLDELGAGTADGTKSHRSDGLEHPAADAVALLSLVGMVALIALLTIRAPGGARRLVLASLAAVAAFAVLGKVLSPQYMLWLVPLGALAFAWRLHALAAAVAAAAVLTQVEFPARYFDLVDRELFPVAVVAVRNLVLVAVLVLALRALRAGAREQQLLERERPAVPIALDQDGVEPRVLV